MSKFGWSLPPGCSNADVERAMSNPTDAMFEAFEANVGLTKEEAELLENDNVSRLLEKMFDWAYKIGGEQCAADEAEAQFYEEQEKLRQEGGA